MTDFQRARTPAQQEQRRQAILAVARTMLDELPLAEISLRELARQVGLAKSNVVRYFPTRESVFLEVLADDWAEWLDAVEAALPRPHATRQASATHRLVAQAVARTVAERPRFALLLASHAGILEHNLTAEVARSFKQRALERTTRLAQLLGSRLPTVDEAAAFELAAATVAFVAGAWPMTHPAPTTAAVLDEPALAPLRIDFEDGAARVLTVLMDGLEH